jgi:hypothetical protein
MKAVLFSLLVVLTISAKSQTVSEGKTKTVPKPIAADNGSTYSQPVPEGKAKIYIKQYNTAIEKAKAEPKATVVAQYLRKASETVENIKKIDPSFNIKPLEDEVARMLAANNNLTKEQVEAAQASSRNNDKQGNGMAGIFMGDATGIDLTGNADTDIKNHKEKISICNENIEKLIAAGSPDKNDYEEYVGIQISVATARIKKLEDELTKVIDKNGLIIYRELIGLETYWSAAKRIFTSLPAAAQVHQMVTTVLQKAGGEEKIMENAKKNYLAMIKAKKFPAAVQKNASLEQQFRKVFTSQIPGETIIKINIITADWTTVRHELTGILLARKQAAAIGVKLSDGTCHYYIYQIKQDYVGSQFVSFTQYSPGYQGEIFCDNIK